VLSLFRALERTGARYAVFGAVALAIHGLPRYTEDLDLFVPSDAENTERLRTALDSVFSDPELQSVRSGDLTDYGAIKYVAPDGFALDLVSRLGEAFSFEDLAVETVEVEGIPVHVVTPETLYRMKCQTVRPKDRIDSEELRRIFKIEG